MTLSRPLAALLLLLAAPAFAAECKPADPAFAGDYTLRGAHEIGSQLRLQANGRFDYMLAYGALDELAWGCWTRDGDAIQLTVRQFRANAADPMKFDRLDLQITSDKGLRRQFDPSHSGIYARGR